MPEISPQSQDEILIELIESFENDFDLLNESHAKKIWNEVSRLILSGNFSLNGQNIKPTAANLKVVAKIIRQVLSTINDSSYFESFTTLSAIHTSLAAANDEYFKSILSSYKPKATYKIITDQAIENMLDGIKKDSFKEAYEKPIKTILNRFVINGGALHEMADLLKDEVLGIRNKDGNWTKSPLINRYYQSILADESKRRRTVRDFVFQTMREYDQVITKDVGLDWFRYSHGTVRDSRKFCKTRQGKIFHRKEIETWPKLDWQGKIPGTDKGNIHRNLGGFNCMHDLRPISQRRVPKKVVQRVRRKGFID